MKLFNLLSKKAQFKDYIEKQLTKKAQRAVQVKRKQMTEGVLDAPGLNKGEVAKIEKELAKEFAKTGGDEKAAKKLKDKYLSKYKNSPEVKAVIAFYLSLED